MSTSLFSNALQNKFNELYSLNLFAKANHNLIAMNGGRKSPYVIPKDLKGGCVGVSFQHVGPAVEVYIRDSLMAQKATVNKMFDTFANTFSQHGVAVSQVEEKKTLLTLFLVPIADTDEAREGACVLIQELCLELGGSLR